MRRRFRFTLSSRGAGALAAVTLLLGCVRSARAEGLDTDVRGDPPPPSSPPCTIHCSAFEAPRPSRSTFGTAGSLVLDDMLGIGLGPAAGVTSLGQGSAAPVMTAWLRYEDEKSALAGVSLHVVTLAIAPALDAFVTRNVSVGAQLALFHSSLRAGSASETSVVGAGLRPRVGWVVPLTEGLYFWPRVFASLTLSHAQGDALGAALPGPNGGVGMATQTALAWGLGADALIVAPLGSLVALTFGPTVGYGRSDVVDGTPGPTSTSVALAVHGGIALTL